MAEPYIFCADIAAIDRSRVHRWLTEESYWAKGRSREIQDAAIDSSRNYGVFDAVTGVQVAYGRVVTDGVTFAWLCDVFVIPELRGHGVGKMFIGGIVADLEPRNLKRILLSTADAHGLYAKYGFAPLNEPSKMMARVR